MKAEDDGFVTVSDQSVSITHKKAKATLITCQPYLQECLLNVTQHSVLVGSKINRQLNYVFH